MATLEKNRILQFRGRELCDRDGDKIGSIEEIYLDADSGEPEWALVNTGLFGTKSTFVPLRDADEAEGTLRVSVDKRTVKDAPKVDPDGELSQPEEAELYRHYGREYSERRSDSGLGETGAGARVGRDREDAPGTVGRDASGPTTDDAMTRSEEELRVGKTERETRSRAAAQVRRHRAGGRDGANAAREGPGRARADHRRERRPARTAPTSPRRSTRSCFTRRSPSSRSGQSPRSASGSTRTSR